MKKLLDWQNIKMIDQEMDQLRKDHPKATVVFNVDVMQIQILYPLPPDFYKLKDLKLD